MIRDLRYAFFKPDDTSGLIVRGGEEGVVCRGVIINGLIALTGICMDDDFEHGRKFMEERVAHFFRDEVSIQNG